MAKLVTTKEKYGVSVAARIDPNLAHQISDKAERLGVSFAQMISMLISKGFNPTEPVSIENSEETERNEERRAELETDIADLQNEVDYQAQLYKNAAAEFIGRVANTDEDKIQFIETYNEVLNEQRRDISESE